MIENEDETNPPTPLFMSNDADWKGLAKTISLTTSIAIPFDAMHTHGISCATFGYRRSFSLFVKPLFSRPLSKKMAK